MYFPFMSSPDPSVTRKSGFLFPTFTYGTAYGVGAEIDYFWALAPNYDLTFRRDGDVQARASCFRAYGASA